MHITMDIAHPNSKDKVNAKVQPTEGHEDPSEKLSGNFPTWLEFSLYKWNVWSESTWTLVVYSPNGRYRHVSPAWHTLRDWRSTGASHGWKLVQGFVSTWFGNSRLVPDLSGGFQYNFSHTIGKVTWILMTFSWEDIGHKICPWPICTLQLKLDPFPSRFPLKCGFLNSTDWNWQIKILYLAKGQSTFHLPKLLVKAK